MLSVCVRASYVMQRPNSRYSSSLRHIICSHLVGETPLLPSPVADDLRTGIRVGVSDCGAYLFSRTQSAQVPELPPPDDREPLGQRHRRPLTTPPSASAWTVADVACPRAGFRKQHRPWIWARPGPARPGAVRCGPGSSPWPVIHPRLNRRLGQAPAGKSACRSTRRPPRNGWFGAGDPRRLPGPSTAS
jgi:hypothetical protein